MLICNWVRSWKVRSGQVNRSTAFSSSNLFTSGVNTLSTYLEFSTQSLRIIDVSGVLGAHLGPIILGNIQGMYITCRNLKNINIMVKFMLDSGSLRECDKGEYV